MKKIEEPITAEGLDLLDHSARKKMDDRRYLHTTGVRYTAAAMAMTFGEDMMKAQAAGLLHDIVKQTTDEKKLKLAAKYGVAPSKLQERHPFLLHARLGREVAHHKYGINDEDLLNAICYHTTGRPAMSPLEQIVFIADYIEPGRNQVKELPIFRKMAFHDLDEACYLILENMLNYLNDKQDDIDEMSRTAFEYYRELHDSRMNNPEEI